MDILTRLSALAEPIRARLLALLERHELTVGELCEVLQLPQSTVSRHLKVLADEGWVVARSEGASRLYRVPHGELEPGTRRLWSVVRDDVGESPAAVRDAERLRGVLAERRARSDAFFSTAAGQWDRMRTELFGDRTELLPLLGLLDPEWVVGDLGCGTGQLTQLVAPMVSQVVAVDASAAMIRSARARLAGASNVQIRRGDLEELPIETGSLDVALLVLVLAYVTRPERVLAEAARALRDGGRLLMVDLLPHDRAEYRQTMGHQWQGFSEAQMRSWSTEAGLSARRFQSLPPLPEAKGPLLFTAAAVKGAGVAVSPQGGVAA